MQTSTTRVPFPREHGAWGMLLGAAILAWAHPGVLRLPAVVLALLFVLAFGVQEPLRAIVAKRPGPWKRWTLAYGALLLTGAAWLVAAHELYVVIPAAVLGALGTAADLAAHHRKLHRTLPARVLGGGALTFVLPATICTMHPHWAEYAFVLWAMIVAHFVTRTLLIRSRVARGRSVEAYRAWRRAAVWAQVPLYAGLGVLVLTQLASGWAVIAFAPGTLTVLLPERGMSMRRSGWVEVAVLLWFVTAVVVSFHVGSVQPALA
jgi:hypothetical protein